MFRPSLVVLLLLTACGGEVLSLEEDGPDELDVAQGPLLGADGRDAADRSCHVVLRSLARTPNGTGGFTTACTASAGCVVVWTGFIDVSAQAVAEGAKPFVLHKHQDATTWTQTAGVKVSGAAPGFQRYKVTLSKNTLAEGLSATALARARIEVAAFIKLRTGARLFDKHRGQSDLENATLSQAGGWALRDDATVCGPPAPPATLEFSAGFRHSQRGALVASGTAIIRYALERLPTCRGTHNGHPAWDVQAFVRFSPGGEVRSGSVRGFDNPGGTPSNASAVATPWEVAVPRGATSAEVWFKNFTGAGSSCEQYDSNYGANYQFQVEPRAVAPVQWVGRPGASTTRACTRDEGAPSVLTMSSYLHQRACAWVEADVYVPGLTDGATLKPFAVIAEVDATLDGAALAPTPLSFVGRAGNDYRFRFEVPKALLFHTATKWRRFEYALRFSTDGRTWLETERRAVERDSSFCNPAWSDCGL